MNIYKIELKVDLEVQAFNEEDARDYINDIFNIDDEIKEFNIVRIKKQ